MAKKTENQWPIQFEVMTEMKKIGRWTSPSWCINQIFLYEQQSQITQNRYQFCE